MATKTRTTRGRKRAPPRPPTRPKTARAKPVSKSGKKSPAHKKAPQSPTGGELTLTAPELANLLGVNRKTVYASAKAGQIPSIRVGRRLLFPKAAIDAWLAGLPRRATVRRPTRSLPRTEVAKQ